MTPTKTLGRQRRRGEEPRRRENRRLNRTIVAGAPCTYVVEIVVILKTDSLVDPIRSFVFACTGNERPVSLIVLDLIVNRIVASWVYDRLLCKRDKAPEYD